MKIKTYVVMDDNGVEHTIPTELVEQLITELGYTKTNIDNTKYQYTTSPAPCCTSTSLVTSYDHNSPKFETFCGTDLEDAQSSRNVIKHMSEETAKALYDNFVGTCK